jgi:hypothetical protein
MGVENVCFPQKVDLLWGAQNFDSKVLCQSWQDWQKLRVKVLGAPKQIDFFAGLHDLCMDTKLDVNVKIV